MNEPCVDMAELLDALKRASSPSPLPPLPHPAGVSAEQQQGLAQSTLDVAFSRTQKARRRATHVVQHSEEAAQWVARSDLRSL